MVSFHHDKAIKEQRSHEPFSYFHPGGYPRSVIFLVPRCGRRKNAVRDALEERGYSEIITPAVEYFDVFAQANPELDQDQMLKIIDKSGRILRGASGHHADRAYRGHPSG